MLDQRHAGAILVEAHLAHVGTHEHDAPSMWLFQVLVLRRVGHFARDKSTSFVFIATISLLLAPESARREMIALSRMQEAVSSNL